MSTPAKEVRAAPVDEGPAAEVSGGQDLVPISVRLGAVVPPEDPEDWRRPLTWVAAAGMLAGPAFAFLWFWLLPPLRSDGPIAGTFLLAAALVAGAVLTGSTQIGPARSFAGTLGGALFGAVLTVAVGAALAGERQADVASPTLVHGFVGGMAGLVGALVASTLMPTFSRISARARRGFVPGAIGVAIAAIVVRLLFAA